MFRIFQEVLNNIVKHTRQRQSPQKFILTPAILSWRVQIMAVVLTWRLLMKTSASARVYETCRTVRA